MAVSGRLFLVEEGMVSAKVPGWAGPQHRHTSCRHCKLGHSTTLESLTPSYNPHPLSFYHPRPGIPTTPSYPGLKPAKIVPASRPLEFLLLVSDPGLGGQLGKFTDKSTEPRPWCRMKGSC